MNLTSLSSVAITAVGTGMGLPIVALWTIPDSETPPSSLFSPATPVEEETIFKRGLDSIRTILEMAATDKRARVQLGKIIRDEDLSQVLTREHIPLLLEAAKTASILLDMAISYRPDLFELSDLAVIRHISAWAAMRLIASRQDWKADSEIYLPPTPYERPIQNHERDVEVARERRRSAIRSAAGAALLFSPGYVVLDLLEGTA